MQYSSLAGGKRIRALLIYATGHAINLPFEYLDTQAMAVELIHTYSLIHDDLPAMDNDDLRRGKPTCHKAFDEASAILAGDALQTLAFELLSAPHAELTASQQLKMIHILGKASGLQGMAGGQALDLASVGQTIDLNHLQQIHQLKTGALITACIDLALAASHDISTSQQQHLHAFGEKIGLAFQIQDDLLDVLGDANSLGKKTGQDAARDKPTYPSLMGIEDAKQWLETLTAEALADLHTALPQAHDLRELTKIIIQTKNTIIGS
jgi:farnesyl diphosphate synthase